MTNSFDEILDHIQLPEDNSFIHEFELVHGNRGREYELKNSLNQFIGITPERSDTRGVVMIVNNDVWDYQGKSSFIRLNKAQAVELAKILLYCAGSMKE